jgi:uncharacterized membrane protein YdjX (TVP38/TMEM64 family)
LAMPQGERRREHVVSIVTVLVIAAAVLLAWRSGYFSGDKLDTVRKVVGDLRALPYAPVMFGVACVLVVLLLLSTTAMSIVGGALFGMRGLAITWAASLIGSAIAYWIGRKGGKGMAKRFFGRHRLLERLRKDMSFWDIARLRVLPIAPFGLLSYLAGMSGVPLRLLIGATALAELPTMTAYVYAGTQLGRALSGGASARSALIVAAIVTGIAVLAAAVPSIVKFFARRRS